MNIMWNEVITDPLNHMIIEGGANHFRNMENNI